MPLYEYKCESCKETFEELRSVNDTDEVTCPKCEKPAKKQMSGFAVHSTGGAGAPSCTPSSAGGG